MTDSTHVVSALLDSSRVAGWIAPWIASWSFLPESVRPYVIGLAVALLVDVLEVVLTAMRKLPVIGQIVAIWESNPRFVSPIIAIGASLLAAGSPLAAIIGGGVRGILFRGNVIETSVKGLKKLGTAVVVVGCLGLGMMSGTAQAQPPVGAASDSVAKVPWMSMNRFHFALGLEQRWLNDGGLTFREQVPATQGAARITYGLSDHIAGQLTVARELGDNAKTWEGRLGIWLVK